MALGSADALATKHAEGLLYPYEPAAAVFQTGSNSCVCMTGSDSEKLERCMAYKRQMYQGFHDKQPNARFVVMNGLLLPGRSECTPLTLCVNKEHAAPCAEHADCMTSVDASVLTFDGSGCQMDLFRDDGIHLNHSGEPVWRDGHILPALEEAAPAGCRKQVSEGPVLRTAKALFCSVRAPVVSSVQTLSASSHAREASPRYGSERYQQMVDLLLRVQDKWGIQLIDMWDDASFNDISDERRSLYMADDIPPTKAGYLEWWLPHFEQGLEDVLDGSS